MTSPKKKKTTTPIYNQLVTRTRVRDTGGNQAESDRFRASTGINRSAAGSRNNPGAIWTKRFTDSRRKKKRTEIFQSSLDTLRNLSPTHVFLTYLDEFQLVPQPPISERDSLTPRAVEGIFVNQIHPELHILESHICQKKPQWVYFLGMPPG